MKKLLFILSLLPVFVNGQVVTTVVGTGAEAFGGDGGPATAAKLNQPTAIAFDKNGNMYVVDSRNYRIRKINTLGIITTIAGNGTAAYSGDNGPATDAAVMPTSIATDTAGNIYFTETNRIRKVSAGIVTTITGDGALGYNGDGMPATAAKVYFPMLGFVKEAGDILFSDSYNHRIRRIDAAGIITSIAGTGVSGTDGDGGPATSAALGTPYFLSGNMAGDIFIPDVTARRIRKMDAAGIITAFAGYGLGGVGGDGGPATSAAVAQSGSVACDGSGNVYLSGGSGNVVRRIDAAGTITTIAGNHTAGFDGDNGPAALAHFNSVNHIAIYNGNIYIADMYNGRIRKIGPPEEISAVNAPDKANHITLHPNPATNYITITADSEIQEVAIINIAGQVAASYRAATPAGKEVHISTKAMPCGVYVVLVNGVFAGRFMKG